MKLYKSRGRFYRINIHGEWVFWCEDGWLYSGDANNAESWHHDYWKEGLQLVGNNFRLK